MKKIDNSFHGCRSFGGAIHADFTHLVWFIVERNYMPRNDQASRILRIINLLEQSLNGLRVSEIQERLNSIGFTCERRTVYRDLEAIQQCGLPVENSDSGEDTGVWKITKTKAFDSKIVITYEELLALFLARESLKVYEGTSIFESLGTFFKKFEAILGSKSVEALNEFCFSIKFINISTFSKTRFCLHCYGCFVYPFWQPFCKWVFKN
jgi:predicted DNA-binding transcriptional regulator YafY